MAGSSSERIEQRLGLHRFADLGAFPPEADPRIRPRGGGDRHADNLERPVVHDAARWRFALDPGSAHTGPQGDLVPFGDTEGVGEASLDHHAAVADPVAFGHLGLVDRGRRGVASLCPRPRPTNVLAVKVSLGDAWRLELHPDHRVRPAVVDDAGSAGQLLEAGEVGGLVEEGVPPNARHHVGPSRGLPGSLVRVVGHAAQDEPEGQHGGGPRDRQQQERGFGRASPQVPRREAADQQDAAHRLSPPVRPGRRAAPGCHR